MLRQHDLFSSVCAQLFQPLSLVVSSRDLGAHHQGTTRGAPQNIAVMGPLEVEGRQRPFPLSSESTSRKGWPQVASMAELWPLGVCENKDVGQDQEGWPCDREQGRCKHHRQAPPLPHHGQIPCVCDSHTTAIPGHSEVVKFSPSISQYSRLSRTPCGADLGRITGRHTVHSGQATIAVFRSAYCSLERQPLSLALPGTHPALSRGERGNRIAV